MRWTQQTAQGFMKDAISLFQKNFFARYKKGHSFE
ncbi:hypothetical protein PFWH6_4762 [Pseudomonas fluorescens WH6]|nr:hypothetical protein PFWH6_4762 [Pseudomonas fluorescens WH6]